MLGSWLRFLGYLRLSSYSPVFPIDSAFDYLRRRFGYAKSAPRRVAVDAAAADPLVGMALLQGSELTMQVEDGGGRLLADGQSASGPHGESRITIVRACGEVIQATPAEENPNGKRNVVVAGRD